jgi:hypothetical protein
MRTVKRHHGLGLIGAITAMIGIHSPTIDKRPMFDFAKEKPVTKSRLARMLRHFKKRPVMGDREKTRLQKRSILVMEAGYKNTAWKGNPTLGHRHRAPF